MRDSGLDEDVRVLEVSKHHLEMITFTVYIKLSNFILFSLESDDMESSKRCVQFFSLVFIIRCLTKSNFIRKRSKEFWSTSQKRLRIVFTSTYNVFKLPCFRWRFQWHFLP